MFGGFNGPSVRQMARVIFHPFEYFEFKGPSKGR